MPKAGIAEERRHKREENAAKANELAQAARTQLLEAKRRALDAADERAEACLDIAITAIDTGYVKAQ